MIYVIHLFKEIANIMVQLFVLSAVMRKVVGLFGGRRKEKGSGNRLSLIFSKF